MNSMKRLFLTIALTCLAALSLMALGLRVRSYWISDGITRVHAEGYFKIRSTEGRIFIQDQLWNNGTRNDPKSFGWVYKTETGLHGYSIVSEKRKQPFGFDIARYTGGRVTLRVLILPYWFIFVITGALPIYCVVRTQHRYRVRRHRLKNNLCISCGYNLTGNISGTCPECGEKI